MNKNNIIPSLGQPNIRYRLGWNDNAFHIPKSIVNVSYYTTYGDGDTMHSSPTAVHQPIMLIDFLASTLTCLRTHILSVSEEMASELNMTVRETTTNGVSLDTARQALVAALAHADGKKPQAYLYHKGIVRGDKYANMRNATPLPGISYDADTPTRQFYVAGLLAGTYPSPLTWMDAVSKACSEEYPHAGKSLAIDWGVEYYGETGALQTAIHDLKIIRSVMEARSILVNFTRRTGVAPASDITAVA